MKYVAFISYSSSDIAWGKRLQRKLEAFRLPVAMCREKGWNRNPLRPVFFAPTDIQPGGLSEELKSRLREARNLIVICSPSSARSPWVGEEIRYFHSLGRSAHIHCFIVDGRPGSGDPQTECFHPVLNELGVPEILGANIHEKIYLRPSLNRERAYVQMISKLLGIEFDTLWNRHRRIRRRQSASIVAGGVLVTGVIVSALLYGAPLDLSIQFMEAPPPKTALPPMGQVQYSVFLGGEIRSGQADETNVASLKNIPRKNTTRKVPVIARAHGFTVLDTMVRLNRKTSLFLHRDSSAFGTVRFLLWNPEEEVTAPRAEVFIDGIPVHSDENGVVSLSLPLDRQKTAYPVRSETLRLVDTLVRPSAGDGYVLLFTSTNLP